MRRVRFEWRGCSWPGCWRSPPRQHSWRSMCFGLSAVETRLVDVRGLAIRFRVRIPDPEPNLVHYSSLDTRDVDGTRVPTRRHGCPAIQMNLTHDFRGGF